MPWKHQWRVIIMSVVLRAGGSIFFLWDKYEHHFYFFPSEFVFIRIRQINKYKYSILEVYPRHILMNSIDFGPCFFTKRFYGAEIILFVRSYRLYRKNKTSPSSHLMIAPLKDIKKSRCVKKIFGDHWYRDYESYIIRTHFRLRTIDIYIYIYTCNTNEILKLIYT